MESMLYLGDSNPRKHMPETKKITESPQTPGGQPDDTTGLGADVRAAKEAALKDARHTVTQAGKVMNIVEQAELTEGRRTALEMLKEKLTKLQAHIDKTEGLAGEIEQTLARINSKVSEEDRLRQEIALAEMRSYITDPNGWNEFIGHAKGVLRGQEYVSTDAAAHPEDATLTALNTRRKAAIAAYIQSTPKAPTTHNWKPDAQNEQLMLGAMKALSELEDITKEYEAYRGVTDGIRALGDRTFIVPTDSTVTLDVRRNNSQTPNMITLSSAPGTSYTSGTSDVNIKRGENGWEVTMKPDFTGRLYINRGTTQQGWNKFDIGQTPVRQAAPAPTQKKEAAPVTPPVTQAPTQKKEAAPTAPPVTPAPTKTPEPAVTKKPEPTVPTPQPRTPAPPASPRKVPATPQPQPRTETPQRSAPVKEKTPTPQAQRETVPVTGEVSLPTNRTAFIRQKNSQIYHYLQPNFANVNWTLGNFADAVRSADGSRWIIKPRKGTGTLETSVDGRTWTDVVMSQPQAPVQKNPSITPTPQDIAPQAAPGAEQREQVATNEIAQTGPRTLEFPVADSVNISYKTSKAYSPKPYALRSKVASVDFYLYTLKKDKGVWKFAMKPGQSGEITVALPNGTTKTFQLGEGVPFDASAPTKKAPTKKAPKTEMPEINTPEVAPVPRASIAQKPPVTVTPIPVPDIAPASPMPELRPRGITIQKQETSPAAPVKKEVRKSPERVDTLFNAYNALYKEYTETMQKDFETYGGNKEWKLFDQTWAQLMSDVEEQFGGNTPRFVDLKGWRQLLSTTKGKLAIGEALPKMRQLLDEYKATKFEKNAPTKVQKIDTLTGNTEALTQNIAKYRAIIAAKGGTLAKDFAKLDAVYTDALKLTKKPDVQKAMLICHEVLAKNYAEAKAGTSLNLFGSAMSLVSDVSSFRPGMTEEDFRANLMERAERTPIQLDLTPKELLQLVRMKLRIDELRAKTGLTDEDRYDELVGIIGDNSGVLERISKESGAQLRQLDFLGLQASTAMKDTFNPETIDWLLNAYVSATPVTGMSDHTFFYIKPTVEGTTEKKAESTPSVASATSKPTPTLASRPTPETPEVIGRELTAAEILALGFVIKKGEKVKEIDDGSYIACTKNSCRPIKPTKGQLEESIATTPIVTPPVTKTEVPVKQAEPTTPTPITKIETPKPTPTPVPTTPEKTAAPEKKNTISAIGREFRLPANESFTLRYDPPLGGSSGSIFVPNSPAIQQGMVVKAQRYSDLWVVNILPQYEGTVTLKRTSDNATESLTVKVDKAALAAIEREKNKTVLEAHSIAEFNDLVLNSPVPVVVDLYAVWCGPCKRMSPSLDQIATEGNGNVRIVKVNGEALSQIQTSYAPKDPADQLYKYPTLIVFEKGKVVRSVIGEQSKDAIRGMIPPPMAEAVTMRP